MGFVLVLEAFKMVWYIFHKNDKGIALVIDIQSSILFLTNIDSSKGRFIYILDSSNSKFIYVLI